MFLSLSPVNHCLSAVRKPDPVEVFPRTFQAELLPFRFRRHPSPKEEAPSRRKRKTPTEKEEEEKKPEEIWPDFYLRDFHFPREKLIPMAETLANLWEVTFYHRELRPDVPETLEALHQRGYHLGIISNNASLYNVFDVLEQYGIRSYMEDVTVSSVTGYRKPHPEIFRISLRQMQVAAENCVYVGDTVSRDIIGSKRAGFGKSVQIGSFLSAQKDAEVSADAERPDIIIRDIRELIPWLDEINPEKALS